MQANQPKPSLLRTLLVLGRVSNLPTVWSNCLAGWILGGGGSQNDFIILLAGASLLYIGGMYLNDAFDASFDTQHRSERPIPAKAIPEKAVWILSIAWLGTGIFLLSLLGKTTTLLSLALLGCVVLYDAVHKKTSFAPVLMASCRFLLYPLSASVGENGIHQSVYWSSFALASYIVGLSYLARNEAFAVRITLWPLLLLMAPLIVSIALNFNSHWIGLTLVSLIFLVWISLTLRKVFKPDFQIGKAVSGLLAGIVWVDYLAVPAIASPFALIFPGLFLITLLLQRKIPAT